MKSPIFSTGPSSRRNFLTRTLAGGTLAAAMGALPLGMHTAIAAPGDPTDLEILNYAMTLEHLEYAFYRDQLARFKKAHFNRYNRYAPRGSNAYALFAAIRDHEGAHVQTLTDTIVSLGGTPVPELTYNFGVDSLSEFVQIAQTLENTGVSAYIGALALIDSPALQTAGASIATVEARHAAFLNLLNGTSPFPAAFDTPKTMEDVVAAITPFIVV